MQRQSNLKELITNANIPGVSIGEVTNNNFIQLSQEGVTDVTNPKKVVSETVFEAASLSKPVFAYIVLNQIEHGLLSRPGESAESGLDRPLYEIFSDGSGFGPPPMREHPNYKLLTARMLLSHQAGLPNEMEERKETFEYEAKPSTQFNYSGLAYLFLMDAISFLTHKNLHQLSQQTFAKLNMKNSSFIPHPDNSPQYQNRAIGHDTEGHKDKDHFEREYPHPAGSLMTTAEDYSIFLQACVDKNNSFIRQHMFTPQVELPGHDKKGFDKNAPLDNLSWGMGIGLQTTEKGTVAFHWGDVNTNRAFCAVNLTTSDSVVCLTNSANGPAIFKQVAEPIVGDLSPALIWLRLRENLPIELSPETKIQEMRSSTAQIFESGIEAPPRASIPDVKTEPEAATQGSGSREPIEEQENTKKADSVEQDIAKGVSSPFRKTF